MRSVLIVVELPSGSPRPPSSLGCYVINVGRETRLAIGCIQIQRGTRIMARRRRVRRTQKLQRRHPAWKEELGLSGFPNAILGPFLAKIR